MRNNLVKGITSYDYLTDKRKMVETAGIYSPEKYAGPNSIPTMTIHGTKDRIVPVNQAKILKKLWKGNEDHDFLFVDEGGHGFMNIQEEEIDEIVAKTMLFMKKQLK